MNKKIFGLITAAIVLFGGRTLSDGVVNECPFDIDTSPVIAGLLSADELLAKAKGSPGAGGLCKAALFVVSERNTVTVWRAYSIDSKKAQKFGNWWSFNEPKGTQDAYYGDNAICREWNDLDKRVKCTLKQGTVIVVGPGQSAKCKNRDYPQTSVNQVYISKDLYGPNLEKALFNCKESDWPRRQ